MTTTCNPILTGLPPKPQSTDRGRCSVSVAWAKEMLAWAGWRVAKGCLLSPLVYPDGITRYHKCYAVYDGGGELQVYSTYGLRYEAMRLWMQYSDKNVWKSHLTTPNP